MTHIVVPNWLIYLAVVLTTINLVLALYSMVLQHREIEVERKKAEAMLRRVAALRDRVLRP